ncbi:MAG TPA: hypothetical protein VHU80_17190 [Polyangiaceae bacterium]|jgi:hypothetical protein|nr:hypothetical protein [Polyangiaceae bacterium]
MKVLVAVLFTAGAALAASPAHARDVVVRRTWELRKPVAEVMATLAAYDQYCARGCRYHVPSVVTAQILAYARHPDDFYVWTSVKDIEDSSWFSHYAVQRTEHGARVEIRMVSPATGETLAKATKREHAPSVDGSANVYELTDVGAGTPKTRVTLTSTVSLSGVAALFGSGIVRDRLEEAAQAMRKNLSR